MAELERIDLSLGQKPTEADWENILNRAIDYINAGIQPSALAKTGGKVAISISGDAATVGGKTADEIIGGDFPELKATLIDALTGGYDLVLKGGVCTKNESNPARLDITACSAIQKVTSTGAIDRVSLDAGYKTTSIANTTYYLDITPAASDYSWGTAHPAGDYVPVAMVTTDLNGHIGTITDQRPLNAELFKGFDCKVLLPELQAQVDDLEAEYDTHAADTALHTKVFRFGHTYAIPGEIKVPSGDLNYVLPFFVSLATGQSAKLAKARYRINSGTSVTCKLQRNGSDITGFTGISVTTTTDETNPDDVTLADNDMLALVVTAVSGTPKNMTFTIFIDYEQ
jgi:hypothetical protein